MAVGRQRSVKKETSAQQIKKLLFDIRRLNPSTQKQQARTLRGVRTKAKKK